MKVSARSVAPVRSAAKGPLDFHAARGNESLRLNSHRKIDAGCFQLNGASVDRKSLGAETEEQVQLRGL
jgi:hypothetical protein